MRVDSEVGDAVGFGVNPLIVFVLLRQLTHEYSLRSRAEALSLRASLATESFVLSGAETTTMTVVSDIIRRVDLEAAKYAKLVATLPVGIDNTGLVIPEADLLLILLRSLPETVRNYCLHHSVGDSYMAFRETAVVGKHNNVCFMRRMVHRIRVGNRFTKKLLMKPKVMLNGLQWMTRI